MFRTSIFVAVMVVAVLSIGGFAQEPPQPPQLPKLEGLPIMSMGGGSGLLQVLRRDEAQSHLHLTAKQKLELEDLGESSEDDEVVGVDRIGQRLSW